MVVFFYIFSKECKLFVAEGKLGLHKEKLFKCLGSLRIVIF